MNKFKCILAIGTIATLCFLAFSSCGGTEDDVVPSSTKGEYKVEVAVKGNLEGFSPVLSIQGIYNEQEANSVLFDENGKVREKSVGTSFDGASYDEEPEFFAKPIIRSTTPNAIGLYAVVYPHTSALEEHLQTHPLSRVTVTFKIFFNKKLVKEDTREIDNLVRSTGLTFYSISLGDVSNVKKQWE